MAVSSVKTRIATSSPQQFLKQKKRVEKGTLPVAEQSTNPFSKPVVHRPQLYATHDGGRLHVALDENYAGSIDTYGCCLTSLAAKIFGGSSSITINGKSYQVKKADYLRWLNSNAAYRDVIADNVAGFLDLNQLALSADPALGRMRDHVSAAKTKKLYEKMLTALVENNTETAKKCAGKGASLDENFWVREGYGLSLTTLKANLPEDKAYELQAARYTPLLYAAAKGNQAFCEFLRKFQANAQSSGEIVKITKKITEVDSQTSVVKSEDFVSSDGRLLTRVKLKTTTALQFEDETFPQYDLRLDPATNTLISQESKSPIVIEKYTKNVDRYTTRYL